MPVTIKINISGDKELLAKLRAADKIIRARVLTEGMSDATRYVAKNAAEYPAETEANALSSLDSWHYSESYKCLAESLSHRQ